MSPAQRTVRPIAVTSSVRIHASLYEGIASEQTKTPWRREHAPLARHLRLGIWASRRQKSNKCTETKPQKLQNLSGTNAPGSRNPKGSELQRLDKRTEKCVWKGNNQSVLEITRGFVSL